MPARMRRIMRCARRQVAGEHAGGEAEAACRWRGPPPRPRCRRGGRSAPARTAPRARRAPGCRRRRGWSARSRSRPAIRRPRPPVTTRAPAARLSADDRLDPLALARASRAAPSRSPGPADRRCGSLAPWPSGCRAAGRGSAARQEARAGDAALAGGGEDAGDDGVGGAVEVGVGEHHDRRLAAELQRRVGEVLRRVADDRAARSPARR